VGEHSGLSSSRSPTPTPGGVTTTSGERSANAIGSTRPSLRVSPPISYSTGCADLTYVVAVVVSGVPVFAVTSKRAYWPPTLTSQTFAVAYQ